MYSFFVLGLIPGTTIQITFGMWLGVTAIAFLLSTLMHSIWKRRHPLITFLPPTIAPDYDYDYNDPRSLAQSA